MSKKAFSFVEVLIATAMIAMAFVPIAGLIQNSFSKVSSQRMEAAVASYAAEEMNKWMFEKPFDEVSLGSHILPEKDIGDGVLVIVEVYVYEVNPGSGTDNDMTFEYYRIPYHKPCGSNALEVNDYPDNPPTSDENFRSSASPSSTGKKPYPRNLDSKYKDDSTVQPLKTIHMIFRWRAQYETYPATGSPEEALWEKTRMRQLLCRRANIE